VPGCAYSGLRSRYACGILRKRLLPDGTQLPCFEWVLQVIPNSMPADAPAGRWPTLVSSARRVSCTRYCQRRGSRQTAAMLANCGVCGWCETGCRCYRRWWFSQGSRKAFTARCREADAAPIRYVILTHMHSRSCSGRILVSLRRQAPRSSGHANCPRALAGPARRPI